ncbi:uroporphyrinogen-III synthase [Chitinophaga filiformis]|uniref:uroporphyrinogen-III synthase n=1 Tax=Chitinophaga filiformis TaxID=104663 RepID=UPI001F1DE409|nr:uroporphyrinogen-III synthase [Chitinophaga filiformis]MCF6406087.1 uroporphyrinogen-III synthase [Chitinophaga filiformis]
MPSNKRYRILSTKAVDQALIAIAAEQNIDIEAKGFISIQPLVTDNLKQRIHQLFQEKATVIFTSVNAVQALHDHYLYPDGKYYYGTWTAFPPTVTDEAFEAFKKGGFFSPGWNVYCLEGATQEALKQQHGIRHTIAGTAANAAALAEEIIKNEEKGPLVFFCGDRRRDELPDLLRQHNISLEELIVYETTETPALTGQEYDGILFLSPSAVESFFSVNSLPQHTVCFSIGPTTARALQAYTGNKIITSTSPGMEQLVLTTILYFNNIN